MPALSVTELMVEVASLQPIATMFVSPAVCALVYATGTLAWFVWGVAYLSWTKEIGGGGGGGVLLETVTPTAAEVVVLPDASRARAVRTCDPLAIVVVSHDVVYGAVVSSAPRFAPSRRN